MDMLIATIIFLLAYILFIIFPNHRAASAIGCAAMLVLLGVFTPLQAISAVSWNVIGIFVGTLFLTEIFNESNMPAFLAEKLVIKSKNVGMAILAISILSSFISAFVENVAVVLLVAPIAFHLAKKLNVSPVSFLIAIAVSANLQGTATLIGDPPSMILAGYAKMSFNDFFVFQGKPGIFFAVQVGAILSWIVLFFVFKKFTKKPELTPHEKITSYIPSIMLILLVISLSFTSYFDPYFTWLAGTLCMVFGLSSVAWHLLHHKKFHFHFDIETTLFLIGVFILVGSLSATGAVQQIADLMSRMLGSNMLATYLFIVVVSVMVSAVVDNVPFITLMIPVVQRFAQNIGISPYVLLFGLLIGTCLGGNITPIGASANVVACGMLKKKGCPVTFWEFMRIGLPFTAAAVIGSATFVWLIWR